MEVISPMVTMLAERMRTNPEDFIGSNLPKFFEIAQTLADMIADPNLKYYWFLNDTEKEMLMGAYRDLCRKSFEDNCMEKLLGDKEEHRGPALGPASVKYKAQGRYGQAQVTGQGQPVSYWNDPRIHPVSYTHLTLPTILRV